MDNQTSEHWDTVHRAKNPDEVSWYQPPDEVWVDLIDDLELASETPVIDVGAGASLLADALVLHGHRDVTVLDISQAAVAQIRERLGDVIDVQVTDVLDFSPDRQFGVWFDRAVFHFLTAPDQQRAYREVLHQALAPDGVAIVATFAPDGPDSCSGLPVHRYTCEQLADVLGLRLTDCHRRVHVTPWETAQPFTIAVMSR